MLWLGLALGSAALLGGYEVARKAAVKDNAVLPVLLTASAGGFGALALALFVMSFFPAQAEVWAFQLEPLSVEEHLAILLKAAIVTTSWVCAYFAVKHLPISLAGPLRSLSPAWTLVGAFVLYREEPRPLQALGMGVLLAGYWGFAWVGRSEGFDFKANRWVWLLIAGTIVGATSGLFDKHLLQHVEIPPTTLQFWFSLDNVMLQVALVGLLWWRKRKEAPFRFRIEAPLVGFLLILADQLYFRALAHPEALVSVTSLVRRSSVLVSFTLGGLLFQEQLLKRKALLLTVICAGLILLFL